MAISRNIQTALAKDDFDTIEEEWLSRIADPPLDLAYFVGVARALTGVAQDDRARLLLDMLFDELSGNGEHALALDLLRRAGSILQPQSEELHTAIVDTVRSVHRSHSSLDELIRVVGLDKAPHDIPKTWTKVDRLTELVPFDVGAYVSMEGRGAGMVIELNLALKSLRIDFETHQGLAIGFRAAPKVLTPLPPGHILRRKLEAPEQFAELSPPELLQAVLESYDRPLTGAEIRKALAGIVDDSKWASWWTAARKHPQVVADKSKRQTYAWAASGADALSSVWQAFASAEPRKQLEQLRRDGARDPDLKQRMIAELVRRADRAAASDPSLALEIYYALERESAVPDEAAWTPAALLSQSDPLAVIAGVADRTVRERAYGVLQEIADDWVDKFLLALAREEDPRTLDLLAEAIGAERPRELERFYDATVAQAQKIPAAFVWMAEKARDDHDLQERNPIRLLQQILGSLGHSELAPYRARMVALCQKGGTVPALFPLLTDEQLPLAIAAIERSGHLEPYQRDDLMSLLALSFPSLRGGGGEMPLYALQSSLDAKQAELEEIVRREIPANRTAIQEAREMGDLRENFEYKSARQRHEYLTARATELKAQISRAKVIDLGTVDPTEIRVGTVAELEDADGGRRTIAVLGPWESDPDNDVISYESELGESLLGKRPGDRVTVGDGELTVASIAAYEP